MESTAEQQPGLATKSVLATGNGRALAIVSPANWSRLLEIETGLRGIFPHVQTECPHDLDELERRVRESHDRYDIVIAVGGDGTVHRVLQYIDTVDQVLAVLPGGTGNDLARTMGFPPGGLTPGIQHLGRLQPRSIDLCTVNGIRYHNSGGFGLDAATLRYREAEHGMFRRHYNLAFVCALFGMQPLELEVHFGDQTERGRFYWALGMNNRDIGKGTRIAPNALLDDGLLDMVLVRHIPKLRMLALMPKAIKGEHLSDSAVVHAQVPSFTCVSREAVTELACDGELHECGVNEVRFEVIPKGLTLLW
jgi:diacylglycerol kinase (ATP)